MQCKEISNLVMRYFDGDISELEREMIIKHNEKCKSCAAEFQLLRNAIDALEGLIDLEVPAGFESRVMEGIRTRKVYSTNPRVVALWFVSILGFMVFAWNIAIFSVVPFIRESGILIAAQNMIIYIVGFVSGILREVLIKASVLFGKILVLRTVLLRDYLTNLAVIVLAFMGTNLFFIYRRKLQEN